MHAAIDLGRFYCHLGQYEEAAELYQTGLALACECHSDWIEWVVHVMEGMRLLATGDLAGAERVLQAGLNLDMTKRQEGDVSGTLANLGLVLCRQGRLASAKPILARSLRLAVRVHSYLPIMEVLPGVALALAYSDPPAAERATEIYGLLMSQPYFANSQMFHDMSGKYLAEVTHSLPAEVAQTATIRGQRMDLWQASADLLAEIEKLSWSVTEPEP
jgi:tetratricopeptide (TPR) repeat protein